MKRARVLTSAGEKWNMYVWRKRTNSAFINFHVLLFVICTVGNFRLREFFNHGRRRYDTQVRKQKKKNEREEKRKTLTRLS